MRFPGKGRFAVTLFLVAALAGTSLFAVMVGPVFVHPFVVLKCWLSILSGDLINLPVDDMQRTIILAIRMPRVCLSVMVGMGLALCGASMQGLFRNPMAEPYVLGMSSGAATGAAFAIVLGAGGVFGPCAISALAFVGATAAIFLVYSIARTEGRVPTETLLLAGIAVGFFLHAVVSFLKLIASHEALRDVVLWLMGSFASSNWGDVAIAAAPVFIGSTVLFLMSTELNALQFGEETAMHLGMEVETIKRILLVAAALITAVSVSLSGIIGFVGLVVPHIVRIVIGGDHRILLPVSALTGGIFLLLADTVARTINGPSEIPVGIITAAIGAPYFIYLLRRRKKAVSWW
jgi:iron complex transport system permease protein